MKKSLLRPFRWPQAVVFILFMLIFASTGTAQYSGTISLDECMKLANDNYPLIRQKGYLQTMGDNNQKGIKGAWLPQVNLNWRATYQSEVTSFNLENGPLIYIANDQYNFGVEVNQTILDGGLNRQQRTTDQANTETEIQKNDVELYKLKDKVLQLYGTILLTKENMDVLQSYKEDIKSRQEKMASSVRNGLTLQSDLDILDAEMLKTDQKMIETSANLKVMCQTLSLFINTTVDENTNFADLPITDTQASDGSGRPELKLFSMQENLLNEKIKLSERKTMPRLLAFGNGAFGRPGYNFLDQKMRFYGLVGLGLTWNISSLYNLSYDKGNLSIQQQMIQEQRDLYQLNQNATLIRQNGEINKLKDMTAIDKTIVDKRKSISKTKANQLDNGTITPSDYLTELNEEKQATLTQRMHEIQLGIAIKALNITTGI
jgi:outer membrane protein TolC